MPENAKQRHVPRVYSAQALADGAQVTIDGDKAHHLGTVLRLGVGDPLIVFDGRGGEYPARITAIDRQRISAALAAPVAPNREPRVQVTLGQSVAHGDRMDYAVAKAVELGVSAIQPLFTARSKVRLQGQRAAKKHAHWQRIAAAAAEQSGREIVPEVAAPTAFTAWLAQPRTGVRLLLHPDAGDCLRKLPATDRVLLLVGPESGWGDDELQAARAAGYRSIGLGPRILRTETAGVAALAALQALWGDLG